MIELKKLELQREKLIAIERARKSILNFTLYTKKDYQVNWHHEALAKKLDDFVFGKIQYLMVFMPPRHGKSELVSRHLPAFIHGVYPDTEIMCASYLDSLAGDMTIDVQKIIDSPEYKEVFPATSIYPIRTSYTEGTRNSSEHHIVGRQGKYRGQGVGGSFTGKGANFIIVDDPIKGREIADSETFRERLWNFYNNDLFSRLETNLETGRKGQVLITQTRWHESDLSGRLLELMKKERGAVQWEIVDFPAIKVSNENKDDPREIGEALWPAKYNLEQLNQIKTTIGPRAWSSLYQQNPVSDGGNIFKDEMFELSDCPGGYDFIFTTADTAYDEKRENDFTCFSVWGFKKGVLYLIDVFHRQVKAVEVENLIIPFLKKHVKYGYRGTYIEPKGHGIYLNQALASKGIMIPSPSVISDFYQDRRFDKVARANNVVPHLFSRKVYFNKQIPRVEEYVTQCLGFPKVKHDDFVDTFVDALKIVYSSEKGILDVL